MKKRVTGIGGIFFKCEDPAKVKDWYNKHLGFNAGEYGGMFTWREENNPEKTGTTTWSPFKQSSNYFDPSKKEFMFNYRVENLEELLSVLKEEGVQQIGNMEVYDYGKFAWILDCENNKIELWEPIDQPLIDSATK